MLELQQGNDGSLSVTDEHIASQIYEGKTMVGTYRCFHCNNIITADQAHICSAGEGRKAMYERNECHSADDWEPDERTVRFCRDELRMRGWLPALKALDHLLPKPDPVKALLEEFHRHDDQVVRDGDMAERAIRWLIETGRIKQP
jgi:hypothetical protein